MEVTSSTYSLPEDAMNYFGLAQATLSELLKTNRIYYESINVRP
jgi:hypothetical protein